MHAGLSAIPGVTCPLPEGAFYCYPDVSALLGKPIAGHTSQSSAELAALVLEEVGVAVVPGEAFGAPGAFRMSYALGDEDLAEGVRRLGEVLTWD
jgi:aspartate/methionine/tyrosine aminotransferase